MIQTLQLEADQSENHNFPYYVKGQKNYKTHQQFFIAVIYGINTHDEDACEASRRM